MLRDRTQSPISESAGHYCYPSGVCRQVFASWLEKQGVLSAATCDPGLVKQEPLPVIEICGALIAFRRAATQSYSLPED